MATSSQTIGEWEKEYDAKSHTASHDFRSDTVTLPSGNMLSAILSQASAFGDDVMSEDGPTRELESYIGELTGMGNAIFVMSGHMGNQIAIRCHLKQPPFSVVCDRRSHIFIHEAGMASIFSQAHLIPVMPKNLEAKSYLTLEEIVENVIPDDGDVHGAPTKVISLENTIWGKVMPVSEVARIAKYAKEHDIKVHIDGARLWNACYTSAIADLPPAEASKKATSLLREYCSHVDSVQMCFSKSLGAPGGSILVGKSPEFIKKARHFRKALGGGMRQLGVLTAPARVAVDNTFLSGVQLPRANAFAKDLEQTWVGLGGKIQPGLGQETNMIWIDLKSAKVTGAEFQAIAKEEGLMVWDGRIVTHYQISQDAVEALKRVFKTVIEKGRIRSDDDFSREVIGGSSYGKKR